VPAQQINPAEDDRGKRAGPEQEIQEEDYGPELDAETILAADDRPMVRAFAPKWGGHVWLDTMSGRELDEYERYLAHRVDPKTEEFVDCDWRANFLARCICDKNRRRLFSEAQIVALGLKSADTLDYLFGIAQRLNKRTQRDIDELKKASAAARAGASQLDSAETSEDGGPPASASES